MADDPALKDPIAFVREIVRKVCWDIKYHEEILPKAYARLSLTKELMSKGGFEKDEGWEEDDEGEPIFENLNQYVTYIVRDREESVEYHEKQIQESYVAFGYIKIMLARGNYTEIDLEEIRKNPKKD